MNALGAYCGWVFYRRKCSVLAGFGLISRVNAILCSLRKKQTNKKFFFQQIILIFALPLKIDKGF